MDILGGLMSYISFVGYIGFVLICAIVAYFTIVKKMDDNLRLRTIVFRVVISFLLGSVTISIFSQLLSALMVSTRVYESITSMYLFQIANMVLYLGVVVVYYWGSRAITMNLECSPERYRIVKLITALMLGCIAKEVLQLIMVIVLFLITLASGLRL